MKRLIRAGLLLLMMGIAPLCNALVTTLPWVPVEGTAQDIAVGRKGEVVAVDISGMVFQRDPKTAQWRPVGRGMSRVAIDTSGTLWAIDQQGSLRHLEGAEWKSVGAGAADLAAAPDGTIVVVTNNGSLARYDPAKTAWQALPGKASHVTADAKGLIWVVGADGSIARRLGDVWIGVEGKARDVAADVAGHVLIVGLDGKIYEWLEDEIRWVETEGAGQASSIAVGGGQLWRVDADGKIYAKGAKTRSDIDNGPQVNGGKGKGSKQEIQVVDQSPIDFTKVSTGLAELAIGSDGSIFGLNSAGNLSRWSNKEKHFNAFPGSLSHVAVNKTGWPLGIGAGGTLVRHDGEAWRTVNLRFTIVDLSTAGLEDFLVITSDNQLYRLNLKGDTVSYQRLLGDAAQASLAADSSFWYRNIAGILFHCDAAVSCTRFSVKASDISVGPGGTLYLIDDQGNLKRFVDATGIFELVRKSSVLRVSVGPNDRPWIIEKNGDVLSSKLFERDESRDNIVAKGSESTSNVTTTEPPPSTVVFDQAFTFSYVDVPTTAPGYPNLGAGLLDITVGLDDQVIVTGYDATADPCQASATGWKGRNWIYSLTKRQFIHMDYLKQVQYQLLIAGNNITPVPWGIASAPPALPDAPSVGGVYGALRGCDYYYTTEYSNAIFSGTPQLYQFGGLDLLESNLKTSALTANSRDLTLTIDMDITLDDWLVTIYPERKINFVPIGAGYTPNLANPIERRADFKFARLGVGASRDVLWATDYDGEVYQYVKVSDKFEKRSIFADDRAQDIGVGKDGSVFIVDLAGRLKKWNPALRSFSYTGKAGVTRVAVTSKGKPIVANFPSSQRVFFAR